MFEAIPERIEVSGHRPTWRVTGGSFEAALDYAREAFGGVAVVAREDRGRWWPRVTLTVTVDPALVAAAPPLGSFADRPEARVTTRPGGPGSTRPRHGSRSRSSWSRSSPIRRSAGWPA